VAVRGRGGLRRVCIVVVVVVVVVVVRRRGDLVGGVRREAVME